MKKWTGPIIVALILVAVTWKGHVPKVQAAGHKTLVQQKMDRLLFNDLLRMRNGKIYMIREVAGDNVKLSPCPDCSIETWTKESLAENTDDYMDIVNFADDRWRGKISQWAYQRQ